MEVRRQLCFTIVPFSLSNPKTISNLFTTHSSELTRLIQTVFEIEGRNRNMIDLKNVTYEWIVNDEQTFHANVLRLKFYFACISLQKVQEIGLLLSCFYQTNN